MNRRVVITGIGMVTPMALGVEENWKHLLKGDSAVGYISLFDASTFPTKIAAEVRNFNFADHFPTDGKLDFAGRNTQFAILAADMAFKDARLPGYDFDKRRFGIYLGSGEGKQDFFNFVKIIGESWNGQSVSNAKFVELGEKVFHPIMEQEQEPNMAAAHLAEIFHAYGPNSNCLTACAASSQALGEAAELIRLGKADIMISGGTHSMIHPLGVTGFNLLTALSTANADPTKASRPFDRKRNGFIVGEGAGILILEELEHAKRRGAHIYGEIAGYGTTADAYRLTDAHPEGRGAIAAMKMAINKSGLKVEDIGYINAHGTSTVVNDKIETLAIREVFKEYAYKVPISSIKSMLGHLIAAAGAVELIVCLLVIRDGIIPPTINYEFPDPDCDLDYVPNVARRKQVDVALSNSFGFGGQNVALIVKRYRS
ncbi:MAG TPA: beta-ketoacyl-[acyl-carrier-protein] synthase family protein [bacterium]|nr:beta-ketoacyl-[acyl-carrier-protein] synthase family protein [bacterium]